MKTTMFFRIMLFTVTSVTASAQAIPARQPVPEAIMIEAQKAVQGLANQVVRGNYDAAFKQMNPEWKEKLARKNRGEKKLMETMRAKFAALQAQGVVIRAMEASVPTVAYEVDFGLEQKQVNGELINVPVYKQWLVFVPTVSLVSATDRNAQPPKVYNIRVDGFQAAISKKGANDWTFIDGADLKAANLRELFEFLPKNDKKLGFPKREKKVLKR